MNKTINGIIITALLFYIGYRRKCKKRHTESLGGDYDKMKSIGNNKGRFKHKFEFDVAQVKRNKAKNRIGTFSHFLSLVANDPDIKKTTKESYIESANKMRLFAPLADFEDVSYDLFKKFEIWLSEKGNMINTIAKHMKFLKKATHIAISIGYIKPEHNPFNELKVSKEETKKYALSESILKKIDTHFHTNFDKFNKSQREYYGAFLFACYTGLRYSDLSSVTYKHLSEEDGILYLSFRMQKTNKPIKLPISVMFSGKAKHILSRFKRKEGHLFLLGANKTCNDYAKRIMQDIGEHETAKLVSAHTARRTCATQLAAKGVPLTSIKILLGHSSVNTTEVYVKTTNTTVLADLRRSNG